MRERSQQFTAAYRLLFLAFIAYISLGLPDAATGVAWPSVAQTFALPNSVLGALLGSIGGGYLISSFLSGKISTFFSTGSLLSASSFLVAIGLIGYGATPSWTGMIIAGAIIGLGSGAIDAGLNNFAAAQFTPRHMNWLHASFGIGAMSGPLIMTGAIVSTQSWRIGYFAIAFLLTMLGALFFTTRARWELPSNACSETKTQAGILEAIRSSSVQLNAFIFFIYGGLESTTGQWAYSVLTAGHGLPEESAGLWTSTFWASLALSRFLLGYTVMRYGVDRILRACAILCIAATTLYAGPFPEGIRLIGLLLVGASLAPFFPMLMSCTPGHVGDRFSAHAVGFQVSAATLGIAAFPALAGLLAERYTVNVIPYTLVVGSALLYTINGVVYQLNRSKSQSITVVPSSPLA